MEIDGRAEVTAVANKAANADKAGNFAAAGAVDNRSGKLCLEATCCTVIHKQLSSVYMPPLFGVCFSACVS